MRAITPNPVLHKRAYIGEEIVACCLARVSLDDIRTNWKRVTCPRCLKHYRPRKQPKDQQ
jgi:hypothetical protein